MGVAFFHVFLQSLTLARNINNDEVGRVCRSISRGHGRKGARSGAKRMPSLRKQQGYLLSASPDPQSEIRSEKKIIN